MKILHMISGGRDSLLSASIQAEKSDKLILITFDNGCIHDLACVQPQVDELKKIHKDKCIIYIKDILTAMTFNKYLQSFNYNGTAVTDGLGYDLLKPYMMNCMCCRVAMYTHSIALANALNVDILSDGTRKDGGFITDEAELLEEIKKLAKIYNIDLEFPVYDMESNFERKVLLSERGLPTKVKEPQCYLGMPPTSKLTKQEVYQYTKWFKNYIYKNMVEDINRLKDLYKHRYSEVLT